MNSIISQQFRYKLVTQYVDLIIKCTKLMSDVKKVYITHALNIMTIFLLVGHFSKVTP